MARRGNHIDWEYTQEVDGWFWALQLLDDGDVVVISGGDEWRVPARVIAGMSRGSEEAAEVERAAVVKYLRECGYGSGSVAWRLADDIENGEHR